MLTVITMDPGHTIDELFTPQGRQQFTQLHDTLDRDRRLPGDHHAR